MTVDSISKWPHLPKDQLIQISTYVGFQDPLFHEDPTVGLIGTAKLREICQSFNQPLNAYQKIHYQKIVSIFQQRPATPNDNRILYMMVNPSSFFSSKLLIHIHPELLKKRAGLLGDNETVFRFAITLNDRIKKLCSMPVLPIGVENSFGKATVSPKSFPAFVQFILQVAEKNRMRGLFFQRTTSALDWNRSQINLAKKTLETEKNLSEVRAQLVKKEAEQQDLSRKESALIRRCAKNRCLQEQMNSLLKVEKILLDFITRAPFLVRCRYFGVGLIKKIATCVYFVLLFIASVYMHILWMAPMQKIIFFVFEKLKGYLPVLILIIGAVTLAMIAGPFLNLFFLIRNSYKFVSKKLETSQFSDTQKKVASIALTGLLWPIISICLIFKRSIRYSKEMAFS